MKKATLLLVTSLVLLPKLFGAHKIDETLSQDHTYEKRLPERTYNIDGWNVFGDIRAGLLKYDYQNSPKNPTSLNKGHTDSKGFYVVPKISLRSPDLHGFMFQATVVGATDFGLNDEDYESRNFVFDPKEKKSFTLLQEAIAYYGHKNNRVLVGREELTTPMIDADDWYMLADSFELARYSNKQLKNTTFNLGYFNKMAGVWDSGANGTEFHSMSEASFIDPYDKNRIGNKGVYFASALYNDKKHHNLQVWEYYGVDTYNILFTQYDYTNLINSFKYDAGLQFIDFDDVGKLADEQSHTHIDYQLYSARFDGKFDNGFNFATGVSKFSDGEGQGATLGAWGGYPYFATGMIFHFFEAGSLRDASSYKAQLGYGLKSFDLPNIWVGYRYTYFDLNPTYSKSSNNLDQNSMMLNGFRVSYTSKKGAYFTGTYESVDLDNEPNTYSLRLIGGYRF